MTDVFDEVHETEHEVHDGEIREAGLGKREVHGGESHEDELTEADLDELEALGAAEDAELILGKLDA